MPAILETEYAKLIGFGYCTLAKITLSIVSKSRQAGIDELEVSEEISINEKHSLLEKTLEYLNKSGKCKFYNYFSFSKKKKKSNLTPF